MPVVEVSGLDYYKANQDEELRVEGREPIRLDGTANRSVCLELAVVKESIPKASVCVH
jgi:hypothetical protein